MNCYCRPLMASVNIGLYTLKFDEFTLEDGTNDKNKYCGDWMNNYFIQRGMIIGTSMVVVVINIAICTFFDKIVFIEKRHTVNDETMGQFKKITIM